MSADLSFELHRLTGRLDRAADQILQDALDISYRRFLSLLLVGELADPSQRTLAEALGVTEPSVSRMVAVLAEAGHLDISAAAQGGRRRQLSLTSAGEDVVRRSRELLERRFAEVVERSGVPYRTYHRYTRALLAALDDSNQHNA